MVSQPEWISISRAQDILAGLYFDRVNAHWGLAYKAASDSILNELASGKLPSRPAVGTGFALTLFDSNDLPVRRFAVEDGPGHIPRLFWEQFVEADESPHKIRNRLITVTSPANRTVIYTSRHADSFEFRNVGLIDNQSFEGAVQSVEVTESALPKGGLPGSTFSPAVYELPKRSRRGRIAGKQDHDYEPIIGQIQSRAKALNITERRAAEELADKIPGNGTPANKAHYVMKMINSLK